MIASSAQGFGAANASARPINGNSIKEIRKRDHGIIEHGTAELCTASGPACQLAAGLSDVAVTFAARTTSDSSGAGFAERRNRCRSPRERVGRGYKKRGGVGNIAARRQDLRPQEWAKLNTRFDAR